MAGGGPLGQESQKMKRTMNSEKLKLQVTLTATGNKLRMAYAAENKSGRDVYLLDAPYRLLNGYPTGDSILGYTIVERDMLTLLRGVLRIPEGLQVEIPEMPYARLLLAGQKRQGVVESSMPLAFNNPYDWVDHEQVYKVRKVRLRIGYVFMSQLAPQPESVNMDGEMVYRVTYRQVIDVQQFAETPFQDFSITLVQKP